MNAPRWVGCLVVLSYGGGTGATAALLECARVDLASGSSRRQG